ncbi:hypothetical protein ACKI2N_028620 [Cupriavidus sp. 30B13]|uniref:hypothetical protein n=1 Tax=Cupriavidus sp. 30B13 TaxID=3384241 RepID=UPI003B906648
MFKLLIFISIISTVIFYGLDVANRKGAHECERIRGSDLYVGEMCFLSFDNSMMFRLYSKNGELLAERTYIHLDPKIIWADDRVIYDLGDPDGKGHVLLPPTRWDWIRARLP